MIKLPHNQKGFTIIEVLVASLIFSVIAIAVSSIFIQILGGQRRAFAAQKIQENGLFALETMSREIRVSKIENQESPDCSATSLTIEHPVNGTVTYAYNNSKIQRTVNGTVTNLTSSNVTIARFNFCVTGSLATDQKQPRVTMLASIENNTTNNNNKFTFNLQTTVSSRDVQIEFEQ